jgi:chemotaxis regulatin CheY-phosphate phosphatase CheZ
MIVPFSQLPDHSRVWIYPSNRRFSDEEITQLQSDIEQFLSDWTAHGASLSAGYCIPHQQFIVFALDEADQQATGCSIDKSVHFIQTLEQSLSVSLLDKMNVHYVNGDSIDVIDLKAFKKMVKSKQVLPSSTVFNHLVTTKIDFVNHWETSAEQSWHSRFF